MTANAECAQIAQFIFAALGDRHDVVGVPPRFTQSAFGDFVASCGCRAIRRGQRRIFATDFATIGSADAADAAIAARNLRSQTAPRRGIPIRVGTRITTPDASPDPEFVLAPRAEFAALWAGAAVDAGCEFRKSDAERSTAMRAFGGAHVFSG